MLSEVFRYLFKMILIYGSTSTFVYFLYVNDEMMEISVLLVFLMASIIEHYTCDIENNTGNNIFKSTKIQKNSR